MSNMGLRWPIVRMVVFVCCLVSTVMACQVPVFRYALERWVADPYRLDVLYRDSLSPELQQALEVVGSVDVNLEIRKFNVEDLSEADRWQLGELSSTAELPAFRLLPPELDRQTEVLWEEIADADGLDALLDSPLRQQIVAELTAGVSAVWIVVPGDDLAEVDAFESRLRDGLATLDQSMKLPDGIIGAGEIDNAAYRPDQPIDLDDVLRSHIPLKLKFSVLRLDPDDPLERVTAKLLSPLLPPEGGAIPVFGRGRALPGIPLTRLRPDVLQRAADYIAGSCSCQVKAENPGVDLLIKADWDAYLNDQLVVSSRELPPLEGVAIVRNEPEFAELSESSPTGTNDDGVTDSDPTRSTGSSHRLGRNLLLALIGFLIVTVIGVAWIRGSQA